MCLVMVVHSGNVFIYLRHLSDFHQVGEQKPNDLTTTAGGVPEGALAGPEEEAVPEAASPAEPKTE